MSKKQQDEKEIEDASPPEEQKPAEEKTDAQQAQEYLDGWKRALADYENLKQDLGKERDQMRQYLTEAIVSDFLTVFDHFEQAIKFQPSLESCDPETGKQITNWLQGVGYVRNAMLDTLKGYGVAVIEPVVGEVPDPNQHEVADERDGEGETGTILEIVSRGWKMGEKVIRPAKVVVHK